MAVRYLEKKVKLRRTEGERYFLQALDSRGTLNGECPQSARQGVQGEGQDAQASEISLYSRASFIKIIHDTPFNTMTFPMNATPPCLSDPLQLGVQILPVGMAFTEGNPGFLNLGLGSVT